MATQLFICFPKHPGTRVGTSMNTCTPMHSSSTAQMTVPTDRHPHSGHRSPPADVPPRARTQMHMQLTLTPSHPHGAMCPLEHMHTWSLCTRGSAGVAGKIWKVDSCSDDTRTSQLPTRISEREEKLHHTCSWAVGVIPGLRAASADFSSSQQVRSIACGTRGPGERKSQSP